MKRSLMYGALAVLLTSLSTARAGVTTNSLGNAASGLTNGMHYNLADILTAQSGQPAPFDQIYGSDVIGPDFSADWIHNYFALANVSAAQITIGIWDNDAGSPGSQLLSFTVGGTDLTATLNSAFEASAAASSEYDEYTVTLPSSLFAALETGSAAIHLELQGPVENPLFSGGTTQQPYNSAALIFSTLQITTQNSTPNPVPEPSSLVLLAGVGLTWFLASRFRRRAAQTAV